MKINKAIACVVSFVATAACLAVAKPKLSTPFGFTDNLDKAVARAKAEDKLVYICFAGSDWCVEYKNLERDIFSQAEFIEGVKDDFVLVFIDLPWDKSVLSDHAKASNRAILEKNRIQRFPWMRILNGNGRLVGIPDHYRKFGESGNIAKAYADHLKTFRNGNPAAARTQAQRHNGSAPAADARAVRHSKDVVQIEVRIVSGGKKSAKPCVITTRFGDEAAYKDTKEYRYRTESNGFQKQEVGIFIAATPMLDDDGMISLNLNMMIVDVDKPPKKNKSDQPFFRSQSMDQRLRLSPGKPTVVQDGDLRVTVTARIKSS